MTLSSQCLLGHTRISYYGLNRFDKINAIIQDGRWHWTILNTPQLKSLAYKANRPYLPSRPMV